MAVLDLKLMRNLRSMASQVVAIGLVMGAGIATFVMSIGLIHSLDETRRLYYEQYRFADVFVGVKRAPEGLSRRLANIPGVARVETRVTVGATIDVPGMREPATAQLMSLPEGRLPQVNRLHLRAGRLVEPYRENEVVIGDAFAETLGIDLATAPRDPGEELPSAVETIMVMASMAERRPHHHRALDDAEEERLRWVTVREMAEKQKGWLAG